MYFVDRSKIQQTLLYIDELLVAFGTHHDDSIIHKLSLERMTHMIIESILDVGNMMIDGFVMRDPGSYTDIIDILVDENVLNEQDKEGYKEVIILREMVVRNYLDIDHQLLEKTISKNKQMLRTFSTDINHYLDNELGVAHAFSNE